MKTSNHLVLSICIPTYNRATYLESCLNSIVDDPFFEKSNIEVIISDNASNDDTEIICAKFVNKFTNIHYYKNDYNIVDKNFPQVISKAKGIYRKVYNDTCIFEKGAIEYLYEKIIENIKDRPVLIFSNRPEKRNPKESRLNSINGVINNLSYRISWIGCYGVWDNDFRLITNITRGCETSFWQVIHCLENINEKKNVLICNRELVSVQKVKKKDVSYGFFRTFTYNYLGILNEFVLKNQMSIICFKQEERRLLFGHFSDFIINNLTGSQNYSKDKFKGFRDLVNYYYKKVYFSFFVFYILLEIIKRVANRFFKKII